MNTPNPHSKSWKTICRTISWAMVMGILTTVAVAWGLTLWRPVPMQQRINWSDTEHFEPSFGPTILREWYATGSLRRLSVPDWKGNWFFADRPIQSWSELERTPRTSNELLIEDARGWPFLALRSWWDGERVESERSWQDPVWSELDQHAGIRMRPKMGIRPYYFDAFYGSQALAYRPIVWGFLGNTLIGSLFWSLVLLGPFVPGYVRRRRRIRVNRCAACRYDLQGGPHDRCPECGVSLKDGQIAWRGVPRWMRISGIGIALGACVTPLLIVGYGWQQPWTLNEAVMLNNREAVFAALGRGEQLDTPLDAELEYYFPLQIAIEHVDDQLLAELVEYAENAGQDLSSSLVYACSSSNPDLLEALLKAGADPNATTDGRSQVFGTCLFGGMTMEQLRIFIEYGAELNPTNEGYWMTPLIEAMYSEKNSDELIRCLIEWGADPVRPTPTGFTPLMSAAMNSRGEVVRMLVEMGVPIDARDEGEHTALLIAASSPNRDVEIIRFLIEQGADPFVRNSRGDGLLSYLWSLDDIEFLRYLIEDCGLDIDAKDGSGQTPLEYAVENQWQADAVGRLLELGASLGETAEDFEYYLDSAATQEIREILIAEGTKRGLR